MNEKKSGLPKILLTVALIVVLLVAGGGLTVRYLQREQWIARTIDTPAMADARKLVKDGRLIVRSLLPERTAQEKVTLYGALLYPEAHTMVCTVDKPKQFQEFAAYLISEDGTIYPGWYNPASMGDLSSDRHNIVKIIFEGLQTDRFVQFHLVDKSKIVGEYDPDTFAEKIVFDLIPPPKESESSSGSSSS